MLEDLDLNSIADDRARDLVRQLLNLLEDVMADLRVAQAKNQRLRDEINRLKGEQGRPTIKSNQPQPSSTDHSSEQERRKLKGWSKGRKIFLFFFNDPATTEIYTLSLHDALPI